MIYSNNALRDTSLQKWYLWLLIPAILINAGGLLIPILEPDGALYATIAKTIAQSGDFVNLRVEGHDWLDKPHFPFWMAALSLRIFGVNAFAYKFPALLFWAAGAWYTYRFAHALYGKPTARLATLFYVSAAHLVISNNDVRAEPYLTGLVIGAVYHFFKASGSSSKALLRSLSSMEGDQTPVDASTGNAEMIAASGPAVTNGVWHLLAGSLLSACAVMTKGPFVLITIGGGFVIDWIIGKNWDQFRNPKWYLAVLLTGIFIIPELYCLYVQFDRHPEKWVFGHTGVSGIRFFFWDSQFGRFFNTGPIRGSGDPLFYFHTVLWAFLPWSVLLYVASIRKCRGFFAARSFRAAGKDRRSLLKGAGSGEAICIGGALISFLIFSLSRFQLPHYLNILFPFFSILTAEYLTRVYPDWRFGPVPPADKGRRRVDQIIRIIQESINVLLPVLLLLICWFYQFPGNSILMIALLALAVIPFLIFRGRDMSATIGRNFWMALLTYGFVNFVLYPAILKYQAGTVAGIFISDMADKRTTAENGNADPILSEKPPAVYTLQEAPANYSLEFYSTIPVYRVPMDSLPAIRSKGSLLLFIPAAFRDSLKQAGIKPVPVRSFPNFHVSQLTGEFLNARTRPSVLEEYELVYDGK